MFSCIAQHRQGLANSESTFDSIRYGTHKVLDNYSRMGMTTYRQLLSFSASISTAASIRQSDLHLGIVQDVHHIHQVATLKMICRDSPS